MIETPPIEPPHDETSAIPATNTGPRERFAVGMLVLATVTWGMGFTWAKAAGDAINRHAGVGEGGLIGPVLLLAVRFWIAIALWFVFVPASRRGWTRSGVARGAYLGGLLCAGLVVQMLGLDRTSEAVNAFLTSLAVLFVPIIMTLLLRKPPPGKVWWAVGVATIGIYLMTGASPEGISVGVLLGLACSIVFSVEIIGIHAVMQHESPWRMTAAMFATTAAVSSMICAFLPGRGILLDPMTFRAMLLDPAVGPNVVYLTLFTTVLGFGLMNVYQPRMDPTRATLVYLMEPVFAALYAYVVAGRSMGAIGLVGAALILVANLIVELRGARRRRRRRRRGGR